MQSLCALMCIMFFTNCSNSKGEKADNKSTKQVTAVIDSLIASEPDMAIESIEVINAKMPAVMADEVQPALKKSGDMIGAYMIAMAFGGHSKDENSKQKLLEDFLTMGAPLREAMKKYDSENHPDYVFGLVRVENSKDSTKNERRLYIFEENDLNNVKKVEKYTKKSMSDRGLTLALAYGENIDPTDKDFKFENIKAIKENPVLMFIVEDIK